MAQNRVVSCRRELERFKTKQANEEAKAARFDGEAARYEEQAARTSSASLRESKRRSAAAKHAEARRARDAAARASKAVADAQKKLHDAEAALVKARAHEDRRARDAEERARKRAERVRETEERSRRERERERDREMELLRDRAGGLEERLSALPWAHSPETINVLFIAASPEDETPLRLDKEVREIQLRVRTSEYRDAVRFHWRPATQVTDLLQSLNEVRPHVVHFSGHGSQGALVFEDADGRAKALDDRDLAHLLHISSDRIRLAVFNSCHSADQAALACDHIDAAIGMDQPVDDEAAKIFAGQFYNAIGFGKSLQEAFEQARLQVKLATGSTSGEPRLYTTDDLDATELYLVRPPDDRERAA